MTLRASAIGVLIFPDQFDRPASVDTFYGVFLFLGLIFQSNIRCGNDRLLCQVALATGRPAPGPLLTPPSYARDSDHQNHAMYPLVSNFSKGLSRFTKAASM
jgi:hypothetical protein